MKKINFIVKFSHSQGKADTYYLIWTLFFSVKYKFFEKLMDLLLPWESSVLGEDRHEINVTCKNVSTTKNFIKELINEFNCGDPKNSMT